MAEFAWDPRTYQQLMAREVPDYPRLQEQLVRATSTNTPRTMLELGVGTGLTAAKLLATAGLDTEVFWQHRDLAVIASTKPA